MSSKILSAQDSRNKRRRSKTVKPVIPPVNPQDTDFRGLPNRAIITIVLSLCGFGLMAVFSASAPDGLSSYHDSTVFLRKQAIACIIGLFVMFTISRYDYRKLKKWSWPMAGVALFLLLLTLVPTFVGYDNGLQPLVGSGTVAISAFRTMQNHFDNFARCWSVKTLLVAQTDFLSLSN